MQIIGKLDQKAVEILYLFCDGERGQNENNYRSYRTYRTYTVEIRITWLLFHRLDQVYSADRGIGSKAATIPIRRPLQPHHLKPSRQV